jgi:hypothetical protein
MGMSENLVRAPNDCHFKKGMKNTKFVDALFSDNPIYHPGGKLTPTR